LIDALANDLHKTAKAKGFYDELDMTNFNGQAKQLAMIHSEVTETLEALRKEQGEYKVVEEIADILIRCLDFYAALKEADVVYSSLEEVLVAKAEVNHNRPRMHGVLG
jgi:NTP pyrophosphatase (non-canonical NTP hydrolase)